MDDIKEFTALCYISEDKNGKETRAYYSACGYYGTHYSLTTDIKNAVFRPAEKWYKAVVADYQTGSIYWYTKIILVYVEVIKRGDKYKYSKTLRDGEDLLKKYQDERRELKEKIKAFTLDLPMFDGDCYLIKTRDDMVVLAEYFPLDHDIQFKLTGHEDLLYEECDYDDEKCEELIKEFRENYFVIGDLSTEDKKLPVVLNRYRFTNQYGKDDYRCVAYTVSEIQNMIDCINKTWNEKIKDLKSA